MHFLKRFIKKFKDHFVPSEHNVYRPHILRKQWLIFFLAVILTTEGVFIVDLVARQSAFNFVAAVLPGDVISLTNDERSQNNVGGVIENPLLDRAAQAKAADMAAKGYFAHVSPDGTVPWVWVKNAGYEYQYAGENLAVRFTDSADVVNAWMASPTHRANIVKPVYTEIGVGVAQGEFEGQPATFVVQYFGTPLAVTQGTAGVSLQTSTVPPPTQNTSTSTPQVAGVATTNVPLAVATTSSYSDATPVVTQVQPQSPWSSVLRNLLDTNTEPSTTVLWILGAVAALLVIGLALTFFVHIQIQPTDMLIGGTVVAVLAISLLVLNSYTPFAASNSQSAAVFGAVPSQGGFIDSIGASVDQ